MKDITRVFSNVALVAVVAMLFTGCALLPGRGNDSDLMYREGVSADDPEFTEVSDDDSLDAIETELDETVIEDEDYSELEAEVDADGEVMMDNSL